MADRDPGMAVTGDGAGPILDQVDSGLILLVFLAFLFAWALNRVRRFFRLTPLRYAGVMVVFILVMLMLWGQEQIR